MTRTTRIVAAAGMAMMLFLLGGIGIWRRSTAAPAPVTIAVADQQALLSATSGSSVEATIASLQERLSVVPDDAGTQAALGLAYVQRARITGDPEALEQAETLLVAAAPDVADGDASGQIGLAALAAARHDFTRSLHHAQRAVRIAPYDGAVYGVLGDALLELGRYDEAFDAFQQMVDVEPGLASYTRVAYARELQGDVEGAREALEFAFGVAPGADDRAFVSYQLGELAHSSGDLRAAAEAFRAAAALAPEWIPPQVGLAEVAWGRGDRVSAITMMLDVTERSQMPEHSTLLGEMLLATGDTDAAQMWFETVRTQMRALADAGTYVDLEVALFEAEHGDPHAALRAASAEWDRRMSAEVADAYAWALYAAGRDEAASLLIDRAMWPGAPSALSEFHAGMIAASIGDDAEAVRHLRAALGIDPWFSVLGPGMARETLRALSDDAAGS